MDWNDAGWSYYDYYSSDFISCSHWPYPTSSTVYPIYSRVNWTVAIVLTQADEPE